MLEIEVKYRNADPDALEAKLRSLGAVRLETRTESDQYFNAPDRDLKQTDEAFRLRRIGNTSRFTYKGPKRDAETKTRPEIEVPLADGDEPAGYAVRMLVCLGYRPVATVTKRRTVYRLNRGGFDIDVCLDDVDRVGTFAEVEIVADESQFESAKAAVLALAAELGLADVERRSYLGMFLAGVSTEKSG
ncbi:MAG: class IV adenylate cyclase [Gemmataceae bacterium]